MVRTSSVMTAICSGVLVFLATSNSAGYLVSTTARYDSAWKAKRSQSSPPAVQGRVPPKRLLLLQFGPAVVFGPAVPQSSPAAATLGSLEDPYGLPPPLA